jgi:hydrogenase expression/formation protein HypE
MGSSLPVGKLPIDLLTSLLARAPVHDPRVLLGPGVGMDCAVIALDDRCLVVKSDPITFATDEIGWYLVQVNANDIATTGALPRWLMLTMLLPEGQASVDMVDEISEQVYRACKEFDISVIGGHTEITYGLSRPILLGTMIGEIEREKLVTPQGAAPGDRILLTKGVPIEATALAGREFGSRLQNVLSAEQLARASDYLHDPGISVLQDAQVAVRAGKVTAMHDPTEGGLSAALWELAEASGRSLLINVEAVPVPEIAARVCQALDLNPLESIASGALILTSPPAEADKIQQALESEGIRCVEIGEVRAGPPVVWEYSPSGESKLSRPARDAITRLYENVRSDE